MPSSSPTRSAAARALPGDDVHIVASYTQFSALYRRTERTVRAERGRAATSAVRVGLVYPELLGTYGDRGNAVVLVAAVPVARHPGRARRGRRAARRSPTRSTCTSSAAARTIPRRWPRPGWWRRAPRSSARGAAASAVLAVCAGFQLIGHSVRSRRRLGARRASDSSTLSTRAGPERLDRRGRRRSGAVDVRRAVCAAPPPDRLREPRRAHDARPGRRAARPGRRRRRQRRGPESTGTRSTGRERARLARHVPPRAGAPPQPRARRPAARLGVRRAPALDSRARGRGSAPSVCTQEPRRRCASGGRTAMLARG